MFPTAALIRLTVLLAATAQTFGAIYTSPSQLPKTTYDYIVVGAGTAGSVIANRLTEDANVSVLLIEAGGSDAGVTASQIPLLAPSLAPNTLYDWNYTTTAQSGYNGRSVAYPRGRILGGSSSINYMIYHHGSQDDWNRYASVTGDSGWNWASIQQYIKKSEKLVAPADGHNTNGQYTPSEAGSTGMISVSLPGYTTPLDQKVLDTIKQVPEFTFTQDFNAGNVLGIGWTQSTIGKGTRSSASSAYLASQYTSRPNLSVLINGQVTKLLKTGTVGGLPSFHSAAIRSTTGAMTTVTANKEIVLSAGSVNTPQLLMLSGIGDTAALQGAGVTPLVSLPSVGKNMSDHVFLSTVYNVNSEQTFDPIFQNPTTLNTKITQWVTNQTGPLADGLCNQLGFMRFPSNSPVFSLAKDPSAGPSSAHYEMLFGNLFVVPGVPYPATGNFFTLVLSLIAPTSRGTITLQTSNPLDKPLINPNYLTTAYDIAAIREAVKASQRFVAAPAWKGYITSPYGTLASATTDASIEAYARNNGNTIWHMVGTSSMSPKGANWGVVDPDLKVKGVEGLRVIDASILPYAPNGHTAGITYIVAERGAAMIKAGQ